LVFFVAMNSDFRGLGKFVSGGMKVGRIGRFEMRVSSD